MNTNPSDKPTLADVVNGTPAGQSAAEKAVVNSMEAQNETSRRASDEELKQERLINFVTNPDTIAKAVEGSMDKRMATIGPKHSDEALRDAIAIDMFSHNYQIATDNQKHRVKKLLKIFTAVREKAELRARIEQTNTIDEALTYHHDPAGEQEYFSLQEDYDGQKILKAELNRLKGEKNHDQED